MNVVQNILNHLSQVWYKVYIFYGQSRMKTLLCFWRTGEKNWSQSTGGMRTLFSQTGTLTPSAMKSLVNQLRQKVARKCVERQGQKRYS